MDDSELVPPSRLSMTDEELEAAVEVAKAGPDGLMAAIVLLEQQTQLRAQDDANFAAYAAKIHGQNQADAAPQPAASEPVVEPVVESAHEKPVFRVVVEPAYEPTTASQASSEFDAILGAAIEDNGDELFSDNDFSVTGTLAQIVEQVNEDFSKPQEELAPELDDQEDANPDAASPAPISAFAASGQTGLSSDQESGGSPIASPVQEKKHLLSGSFFDSLIPSATTATVAMVMTMLAHTEAPVTSSHFYGLLLGMLLATSFGLLYSKANRLAGEHLTIVSRSTFGVWGAALPAFGVLIFKLVAIASLVLALATPLWRAFNLYAPTQAGALRPEIWPELAAVVMALALLLVLARYKRMSRWIFAIIALALFVVAVANFNLSAFSVTFYLGDFLNTAVQTSLTYLLVQLAFGLIRPLQAQGSRLRTVDYLAANLIVPAFIAAIFFMSISVSQQWLAASSAIMLIASVAALATMLKSASDSVELLLVKPLWVRLSIAFALIGGATYLVEIYLVSIPLLVTMVAVPAASAVFATLADQVARRAKMHEVSLVRGYGFYGRVSAINIVGFVLSTLVGLALLPSFSWSSQTEAFAFLGAITAPVAAGLVSFLYTVTISRIRVERQEIEVMKVERRKNELAGIDEIVGLP